MMKMHTDKYRNILVYIFISAGVLAGALVLFTGAAAGVDLSEGSSLLEAGKFAEAQAYFQGLLKEHSTYDSLHYYLGMVFFAQADYKKAVKSLERALKLNDESSEYNYWLGNAAVQRTMEVGILKKMGYAKKARKSWERAVELDPDNLDARMCLVQFYGGAPGIIGGGDDKAMEQAVEIMRRDSSAGILCYGMIYASNGEYEKAAEEYQAYLQAVPEDSMVKFSMGIMYHDAEDWEKAYEVFEALVVEHPAWNAAWYQVGRTGALSGLRLERAEEALRHYLDNPPGPGEPSHAAAHYRLGNVYEKAERFADARREYEKSLELAPDSKDTKEALKRCKGK